ncbi:MAG: 50S ribosomal protein L3 [Candidatus Hadarchaeales archaeon]
MGRRAHRPRRGSLAYSPRVRAKRPFAHVRAWPESSRLGLQGVVGYKAGMLHVFMIDDKKTSVTSGQEICVPATVVETPPIRICAVRLYRKTPRGLRCLYDVWTSDLPKELSRRISVPKKYDAAKAMEKAQALIEKKMVDEIRVLACTQPAKSNVPKKTPEIVEIRVGGSSLEERWNYAKGILGKEMRASEVFVEGQVVDVLAITKGKGFQGPVKRWGVKILPRKEEGGRRQVGSLGPWVPSRIMWTVPSAGQMGYHQRCEFNKRILKIGSDGKEITPKGGFLRYGPVRGDYILLAGSIPGPTKRLVHLRQPVRPTPPEAKPPTITYLSLRSPQGA